MRAQRRRVRGVLEVLVLSAGRAAPMVVWLSWRRDDPYAVVVTFPRRCQVQRWLVSRCVLAAGLHGPSGMGDVSVLPTLRDPSTVEVVLSSPSGRVALKVDVAELTAFLQQTWEVVPAGDESRWIRFEPRQCSVDGDGGVAA